MKSIISLQVNENPNSTLPSHPPLHHHHQQDVATVEVPLLSLSPSTPIGHMQDFIEEHRFWISHHISSSAQRVFLAFLLRFIYSCISLIFFFYGWYTAIFLMYSCISVFLTYCLLSKFLRRSLMIFIIKDFRIIVFIFIVISTTFRPICPPAFFRCLLNSGTFTERYSCYFVSHFFYKFF